MGMFGGSVKSKVAQWSALAKEVGLSGLVCSPAEAEMIAPHIGNMTVNTPNIRPEWSIVKGDDQNASRGQTLAQAVKSGVITRFIMGRPILQAKPNNDGLPQSPREAVELSLAEIGQS